MTQIIISNIYAIFGLISIFAYLPQIKTLWIGASAPTEISVKTWSFWAVGGLVTLSYAALCLQDILFCALTVLNLVCTVTIIMLVLYNRYVRYGNCYSLRNALFQYYLCRPFFGVVCHLEQDNERTQKRTLTKC
jgi:lipid-A-disaccharide synthase-like uncharacterized protein